MDDINLKNIRVIPTQLDLRGNYAKTLADLVPQLQSNGLIRGVVINSTKEGEIIFHTPIGRFISPNPMGLSRGDTITIRLAKNGEQLVGNIFTMNTESADGHMESVNISFVKTDAPVKSIGENTHAPQSQSTILNLSGLDLDGEAEIDGSITYINLNKLNSNSLLYKTLTGHIDNQQQNIPIKLALVDHGELTNGIQFTARVASNPAEGEQQMLRTSFGIITLKDAPHLPINQELNFAIVNVNNKPIEVSVKNELVNFIFNLNTTLPKLQKFLVRNEIHPKNELSPPNPNVDNNTKLDAVINLLSGKTDEIKLNQTNINTSNQLTNIVHSEEINDTNTDLKIKANVIADKTAVKINQNLSETSESELIDNEAVATMITNKIASELTNLSNVMANVRLNTRKLANNLEQTIEEIIEEEGEAKAELKLSKSTLDKILKDPSDLDDIKKLSSEISTIKDILNMQKNLESNQPFNFMLPFYINDELHKQEAELSYVSKDVLRILINLDLLEVGQLQLDGLIKFRPGSRIPETFDLIIRSRNNLDNLIQNQLNNIFLNGQDITGIKGNIAFEAIK